MGEEEIRKAMRTLAIRVIIAVVVLVGIGVVIGAVLW